MSSSWLCKGVRAAARAGERPRGRRVWPKCRSRSSGYIRNAQCTAFWASAVCRACGVILDDQSRQYCEDCLPAYREEQVPSFTSAGRTTLQELRASEIDPSQTSAAAENRRIAMKKRREEELEWNAAHPAAVVDGTAFVRDILPRTQGLPLAQISGVTGLSQQCCSLIRRGLKAPQPHHWERFKSVTVSSEMTDTSLGQ